jgi:WXG100 family type VII secretion target
MANGDMLLVNFAALEQAGADINNAINKLTTSLDNLAKDAAPLVSTWDGAAQEAYQARQAKWTAASQDLQHILQNIRAAVDQSREDYVNTEKQATQRFQ